MKAIVQQRYGSAEELKLEDVDRPVPGDGEVLVRVYASAVNAADWHFMRGDPWVARLSMGLGAPKARILGRDFAGRVEAVGKNATRFQPGDDVYGDLGNAYGAFAEYVHVAEDAIEVKPANLTFEQAAAVPLAGGTAVLGLRQAGVRAGHNVLINGASGGVGTFAVQIARAIGAEVTAVCSTRNLELVRSLGADHVVDYTREDFTQGSARFNAVFDLVGNRSLATLRRPLTPDGVIVLSGGGVYAGRSFVGPIGLIVKGALSARFMRRRVKILSAVVNRDVLQELRALIESGKVKPLVERTYPLGEAPDAIRYVEQEHARAKVVITLGSAQYATA